MFSRILSIGMNGPDVQELQIKLAGFNGSAPDGDFGPGTKAQIIQFEKDYMKRDPIGCADQPVFDAITDFANKFPFDFNQIKCKCGKCSGFGNGLYKGQYEQNLPQIEVYNLYEYPGVHKVTLWAARAIRFYYSQFSFIITSGYRCQQDNIEHNRTSTNHRGKAVDLDIPLKIDEEKSVNITRCNGIRNKMVEIGNFQIAWSINNKKAFEPSNIAPTWVHLDVRQFDQKYLTDNFFVKSLQELDA